MARLTHVTDVGLTYLSGVSRLGLRGCRGITDAGLLHLRGVRELWVADAGLAQLEGPGVVIHRR